jgi:hypothetical protein
MHIQIVMDHTGDSRHYFDLSDHKAAAEARKRLEALTKAGYNAAKRTGSGTSELLRQFDPTVQETVFIPRLVEG